MPPTHTPVLSQSHLLHDGRISVRVNSHEIPQPLRYDMHYPLEFGVLLSGGMRRRCGSWEGTLEPGDVWFQGPWEPHGFEVPTAPTAALVIFTQPSVLAGFGAEDTPGLDWVAPFTVGPALRPKPAPSTTRRILRVAQEMAARQSRVSKYGAAWDRLKMFELLLLAREHWTPPLSHYTAPPLDSYSRIDRAVTIVLASRRPVSLDAAAHACSLSRKSFSRLFKAHMGVSFAKYCLRHRLSEAASQLLLTDDAVKKIASDWGFSDTSHFGQCFQKHYGVSPTDYRTRRD